MFEQSNVSRACSLLFKSGGMQQRKGMEGSEADGLGVGKRASKHVRFNECVRASGSEPKFLSVWKILTWTHTRHAMNNSKPLETLSSRPPEPAEFQKSSVSADTWLRGSVEALSCTATSQVGTWQAKQETTSISPQ